MPASTARPGGYTDYRLRQPTTLRRGGSSPPFRRSPGRESRRHGAAGAEPRRAAGSSCNASAQTVVHVQEANRPHLVVDDKQGGNRKPVHQPQRFHGEIAAGDGFRVRVHDFGDGTWQKPIIHVTPKIAVGDDTDDLSTRPA